MAYMAAYPHDELFPAWAGVILMPTATTQEHKPFPRMGGGDPYQVERFLAAFNFSPHGRG